MKFFDTDIEGVVVIDPDPIEDDRGFFARTWCAREFEARGLNPNLVQCSTSFNRQKHTLRGLHYQLPPHAETKLVRCITGKIYDVAVDLRAGSPTYGKSTAAVLSAENRHMLYVPEGCAHGFQTLVGNCEVFYQISAFYTPDAARGIRWDDPDIAIDWPERRKAITSERDRCFPSLADITPLEIKKAA